MGVCCGVAHIHGQSLCVGCGYRIHFRKIVPNQAETTELRSLHWFQGFLLERIVCTCLFCMIDPIGPLTAARSFAVLCRHVGRVVVLLSSTVAAGCSHAEDFAQMESGERKNGAYGLARFGAVGLAGLLGKTTKPNTRE